MPLESMQSYLSMLEARDTGLIYKPVTPDTFPIGAYFLNTFGDMPKFIFRSKPILSADITTTITEFLSKTGYTHQLISKSRTDGASTVEIYQLECENGNSSIIEIAMGELYELDDYESAVLTTDDITNQPAIYMTLYSSHIEHYDKLSPIMSDLYIPAPSKGYINMLIRRGNMYDLKQMKISSSITIDIESNYNDDFKKVHNVIVESLSEKNRGGLVLLHGLPGTGKSYYLRHLANVIDKQIIYIPPYLTEFLTSPEMLPFLMEFPDSILLIEDAEKVITDREQTGSSGVSNILNITDGILSDLLKMQIVATFNMDKDNIDKALLRKGRLIAEYDFDKLSVEKSNLKLNDLNKDYVTDIPLSLTEIYNIDDIDFGGSVKKIHRQIGFS